MGKVSVMQSYKYYCKGEWKMIKEKMEEMRNIIGGATYTAYCDYCEEKFPVEYNGTLTGLNSAKVSAGILKQNHMLKEHYDSLFG